MEDQSSGSERNFLHHQKDDERTWERKVHARHTAKKSILQRKINDCQMRLTKASKFLKHKRKAERNFIVKFILMIKKKWINISTFNKCRDQRSVWPVFKKHLVIQCNLALRFNRWALIRNFYHERDYKRSIHKSRALQPELSSCRRARTRFKNSNAQS